MRRIALVLAVAWGLAATCAAQAPSPRRLRDETAIRQVLAAYQDAWNRHDARAFAALFAPDADFTNVRGLTLHGRAAIARAHATLFATLFKNSHNVDTQIAIRFLRPDVAAVDVRWEMTGAMDHRGRVRPKVRGLRNLVFTEERGTWAIAVFHNMEIGRDLPPP